MFSILAELLGNASHVDVRIWKNRNHHTLQVRMKNGEAVVENSLAGLQNF